MLSRLCVKNPIAGEYEGLCFACGQKIFNGYKYKFSGNFTGYSYLVHGNGLCSFCYGLFTEQDFRRKCWVATQNKVEFGKKDLILRSILFPPEFPCALYLTKGMKKQGWLNALRMVNHNKETFFVMTDFLDKVFINKWFTIFFDLCNELTSKGITKTELLSGQWKSKNMKKGIEEEFEKKLFEIKNYLHSPQWELCIYLI